MVPQLTAPAICAKPSLDANSVALRVLVCIDARLQHLVVAVGNACEYTPWWSAHTICNKVTCHGISPSSQELMQRYREDVRHLQEGSCYAAVRVTWHHASWRECDLLVLVVEVLDVGVKHQAADLPQRELVRRPHL